MLQMGRLSTKDEAAAGDDTYDVALPCPPEP